MTPAAQWMAAAPLWSSVVGLGETDDRPALLRFASDTFVADLTTGLATDPSSVKALVATPRSYRPTPPGAPADWQPAITSLKLFQPVHGHFNVVAASLVCRLPSLPDRTPNPADAESVGFVVRKLAPGASGSELAWAAKTWRPVPAGTESRVLPDEAILPLSPLSYGADKKRRLYVGLIPTSNGDALKAASTEPPAGTAAGSTDGGDPRMDDFETRVLGPLKELRDNVAATPADVRTEASRFLLVDFGELLSKHLPSAWQAISTSALPSAGADRDLYQLLESTRAGSANQPSVRWILLRAWAERMSIVGEESPPSTLAVDLSASPINIDDLRTKLRDNLGSRPWRMAPQSELAAQMAEAQGGLSPEQLQMSVEGTASKFVGPAQEVDDMFVIRCVFRRPNCRPPADVVSQPSTKFAIAGFFDIDAPARSLRVQLPIKTAIADLRKYPKNVGFPLSDQLREQMCRATDMKKILSNQMAACEPIDIGMLCSFSIPVITICALIVLMIFINLLNIVFWWLPFLRICLPIPLKGKQS